MVKAALAGVIAVASANGAAGAADEIGAIQAAMAWARPVLSSTCDWTSANRMQNLGGSRLYDIRFRYRGQGQDEPDEALKLVQLPCKSQAGAVSFVFLAAGADAGAYTLLSFAEPIADYDYTDETFTELVAPPKVTGFITRSELMNARFDPATGILRSSATWRGRDGAWSQGEWRFSEGEFVLSRYVIDPTDDVERDDAEPARQRPEPRFYVLYPPQQR